MNYKTNFDRVIGSQMYVAYFEREMGGLILRSVDTSVCRSFAETHYCPLLYDPPKCW